MNVYCIDQLIYVSYWLSNTVKTHDKLTEPSRPTVKLNPMDNQRLLPGFSCSSAVTITSPRNGGRTSEVLQGSHGKEWKAVWRKRKKSISTMETNCIWLNMLSWKGLKRLSRDPELVLKRVCGYERIQTPPCSQVSCIFTRCLLPGAPAISMPLTPGHPWSWL